MKPYGWVEPGFIKTKTTKKVKDMKPYGWVEPPKPPMLKRVLNAVGFIALIPFWVAIGLGKTILKEIGNWSFFVGFRF